MFFQADGEDCLTPLLSASFEDNIFNLDTDNIRFGFLLQNDKNYVNPFPRFSNFGLITNCEVSAKDPIIHYQFGRPGP